MTPERIANGTADPDRLAARLIEGLPVTARRLDVAGVSTSLLEGGEGPPMVLVHGELETLLPDEQERSTFVDDAEDAISREHTTWSASRQG